MNENKKHKILNRKGVLRRLVAFFLVLVLGIESLPYNDMVVQAETSDLPFKLEDTTYGIKNSNIKAKKLTITSDNTEVSRIGGDLTLLKETHEGKKKIYVIGVNGLICSYETSGVYVSKVSSYDSYELEDSDVFYTITNWETNKKDLINATKGEVYKLAASSISAITVDKENRNAFTSIKNEKILGFFVEDEDTKKILNCEGKQIIDFNLKNREYLRVYRDEETESYMVIHDGIDDFETELYLCSDKKVVRHLKNEDGCGVELVASSSEDRGNACYGGWWAVDFYERGVKGQKIAWLNARDGSLNYSLSAINTEKEWASYFIRNITESGIYVQEYVYDNDNNEQKENNLYYVNEKGKTKLPYNSIAGDSIVKLKDGISFWGSANGETQTRRYVVEKEKQVYKTNVYTLCFWQGSYGIERENVMSGSYYLVDAMGNRIKKLEDEWISMISTSDNRENFDIAYDRFLVTGRIVYDIEKDTIWDCLEAL